MSDLLDATDKLNFARRLVQAADMAAAGMGSSRLDHNDERCAIAELIGKALGELEIGIAMVEAVRLGRAA